RGSTRAAGDRRPFEPPNVQRYDRRAGGRGINKGSLEVHCASTAFRAGMRILDVCAFYAPEGGGVRTYIDAKMRAAPRFSHEMIVVAPGKVDAVVERVSGAILVTLASPKLPVDRRYRYFHDERSLHRILDEWRPDHVEA